MRSPHRATFVLLVAAACTTGTDAGDLPLAAFAYDHSQPLDVQITPFTGSALAYISQISYASPGGGRVTGFLAEPRTTTGPYAGIVMLHDLTGGPVVAAGAYRAITQDGGVEMAVRGAIVVSIDAPWVRRAGAPDFTIRDSAEQVQVVQDLRRAVDYLLTRSDVDPARLAYMGGGYGGAIGGLVAGVETRLKAFSLFVPDGGLVARYTAPDGSPLGALAQQPGDAQTRWLAAMQPIEPLRFIPLAPPAALLIQSAQLDQEVTVADAQAVQAAAHAPRTLMWYNSGHALPEQAKTDRFTWLSQRIGTLVVP